MRTVNVCEHAGFCFGAGRAVDMLTKAIEDDIPVYTYGPILNNDKLVEYFSEKGVTVVCDVNLFDTLPKGRVVIRSHGVSKEIFDRISQSGNEVFDATCPFVKRIHKIVEEESGKGSDIVVIGNPRHPEVEGIVGWSLRPCSVLETEEEINNFSHKEDNKLCIVSQTTFNRIKFEEYLAILRKNCYNTYVMNTICDATRVRQGEALEMSKRSDVMIVIGDSKSSNSRKLYEICKSNCVDTYFIQTVDDIRGVHPDKDALIGITAGASTPKYIIEEVQNYVRHDF